MADQEPQGARHETGADNARTVRIDGELDVLSVPKRLRESAAWFQDGRERIVVDLGGVDRSDSAGVALLLEWIRDAEQANVALHFVNAPAQMRAIIDFCALGDVIKLDVPHGRH